MAFAGKVRDVTAGLGEYLFQWACAAVSDARPSAGRLEKIPGADMASVL